MFLHHISTFEIVAIYIIMEIIIYANIQTIGSWVSILQYTRVNTQFERFLTPRVSLMIYYNTKHIL